MADSKSVPKTDLNSSLRKFGGRFWMHFGRISLLGLLRYAVQVSVPMLVVPVALVIPNILILRTFGCVYMSSAPVPALVPVVPAPVAVPVLVVQLRTLKSIRAEK